MSRDINKAVILLQEFFAKLKPSYERDNAGATLIITFSDRTPIEQLRLFCQGRLPEFKGDIVTDKDGFINKSKHNALPLAKAIDVAVQVGKVAVWDKRYYANLGKYVSELGYTGKIRWGGAWGDTPHFEVLG